MTTVNEKPSPNGAGSPGSVAAVVRAGSAADPLLEDHYLDLPHAPHAPLLWGRALALASLVLGLFLLDRATAVLLNFWLLESLGFESVFWINFRTGALLFVSCTVLYAVSVAVPAVVHGLSATSRAMTVWAGGLAGVLMGLYLAGEYREFLTPAAGVDFGEVDPVFGLDIAFYLFDLPLIEILLQQGFLLSVAALISASATSLIASRTVPRPENVNGFVWRLGRAGSPLTVVALVSTGLFAAANIWLGRYRLLWQPNFEDSTELTGAGASYIDVTGFFSTVNSIYVETLAILALAIGISVTLVKARRVLIKPENAGDLRKRFGPVAVALVLLPGITTDLAFRAAVAVRDETSVVPNEAVVDLPYLQRHIDATNTAFGLADIEEETFVPKGPEDPPPDLDGILDSATIQNSPLWSGQVSRYGRRVAPQYVPRILAAEGDMTVYGPTLESFQAQQKLRPYYEFLDVDTIVVDVEGEQTMLASSVRELPQDLERPWLGSWGQRSLLLTRGHGLVTAPVAQRTSAGDPAYSSFGVPSQARHPALDVEQQAIYYGEGATNPAFTGTSGVLAHDVATEQGRAEVDPEAEPDTGIPVDSLLKRLVIGYHQGDFIDTVFSGLIGDNTQAHIFRRPIERVEQVAPFLLLDTNPYAVPAQDGITWMVNAMTAAYQYPYSGTAPFGDNSDLRTEMRPLQDVNYIADSVKATVDAATGEVVLYQISDEPVVQTWAAVYPDLFTPLEQMPEDIRAQMQYPREMMSIQFNMIYPFYHQRDALTFFSSEDLMDDGDEVVGPIRGDSGAITFSQGLYNWMVEPGDDLPESSSPVQFALTKTYTPQDALNLRALVTAYQLGEDYGKLSSLKIPKGEFFLGPEQADAAIDQDSFIAQQIGLWNRLGVEVIRGNTTILIVQGEAIYVEPLFIRSRQMPVPQLQRVVVVFRGEAHMGRSIEEALTFAIEGGQLEELDDVDLAVDPEAEATLIESASEND